MGGRRESLLLHTQICRCTRTVRPREPHGRLY
jgi:hypothetical protein